MPPGFPAWIKRLAGQIHAKQLLRKFLGESMAGAEGEIPNLIGKMKLNDHVNRNPGEFMDFGKSMGDIPCSPDPHSQLH